LDDGSDVAAVVAALRTVSFDFDAVTLSDALWASQYLPKVVRKRRRPATVTTSSRQKPAGRRAERQPVRGLDGSAPPAGDSPLTTAGSSSAAGAGRTGVYVPTDADRLAGTGVAVSPVRMPAGVALPNGLEIVRALRSIPARRASRTETELDTDATVDATARNGGG
jgi:hypothetical protein